MSMQPSTDDLINRTDNVTDDDVLKDMGYAEGS